MLYHSHGTRAKKPITRPASPKLSTPLKTKPSESPDRLQINNFLSGSSNSKHRVTQSYSGSVPLSSFLHAFDHEKGKDRPQYRSGSNSRGKNFSSPKRFPQSASRHGRTNSYTDPRPGSYHPSSRLRTSVSRDPDIKPKPLITKYAHWTHVGYDPNNRHKVNQDNFIECLDFADHTGMYLFAVADGHGIHGHEVSLYIKQRLPLLLGEDSALETRPRKALTHAVLKCNAELRLLHFDTSLSGSTLTLTLIHRGKIWCGNVGDSRTLLARQAPASSSHWMAIALSRDHKPDEIDEAARVIAAGGRIEPYQDEEGNSLGPARVWLKHQDIPGLAMTRSLGDAVAASVGVIPEPEIIAFDVTTEDKFLIIGSDGIFEFVSNEDAVRIVVPYYVGKDAKGACEALAREARKRWTKVSLIFRMKKSWMTSLALLRFWTCPKLVISRITILLLYGILLTIRSRCQQ